MLQKSSTSPPFRLQTGAAPFGAALGNYEFALCGLAELPAPCPTKPIFTDAPGFLARGKVVEKLGVAADVAEANNPANAWPTLQRARAAEFGSSSADVLAAVVVPEHFVYSSGERAKTRTADRPS